MTTVDTTADLMAWEARNAVVKPCNEPCHKCGGTDIHRHYFARDGKIVDESNTAPWPKHVYKTMEWKTWAAVREFIGNTCRTCHFRWQAIPLKQPKVKRSAKPVGEKHP